MGQTARSEVGIHPIKVPCPDSSAHRTRLRSPASGPTASTRWSSQPRKAVSWDHNPKTSLLARTGRNLGPRASGPHPGTCGPDARGPRESRCYLAAGGVQTAGPGLDRYRPCGLAPFAIRYRFCSVRMKNAFSATAYDASVRSPSLFVASFVNSRPAWSTTPVPVSFWK